MGRGDGARRGEHLHARRGTWGESTFVWSSLTATRRGGRGKIVVCADVPSGEVPATSVLLALYQRASYTVPKLPLPSLPMSRKQLLSMRVRFKSSGSGGSNAASSNAVAATVFEREGTSSVSCRNAAGLGGVTAAARGATGVELARARSIEPAMSSFSLLAWPSAC